MAAGSGPASSAAARAGAWMESRPGPVPDELAEAVREALARAGPGPGGEDVAGVLARAAVEALDRIAARGEAGRAAALPMLAADACLAYAFEAAAGSAGDLEALARRLGPRGLLGERLARALPETGPGREAADDPAPAGPGRGG